MDITTHGIQKAPPWTLLYADDVLVTAPSRQELQDDVHRRKVRLQQYSLKLNIKKTKYMELGPKGRFVERWRTTAKSDEF